MGLHHATLKAAVLVYAALLGTMPDQALKDKIGKDEKGFSPEEVDEIFNAIVAQKANPATDSKEKPASTPAPEAPQWAKDLLKSNQAVIDSNMKTLDGISRFQEAAGGLAQKIVGVSEKQGQAGTPTPEAEKEIDPKATYVVAKGSSFRDRSDFKVEYQSGEKVSHLEPEVLKSLLNRGLIEEA